jgi:N-acetylneuraminic acid mutarotase
MKPRLLFLILFFAAPWLVNAQNLTISRVAKCPEAVYGPSSFTIGDTVYIVNGTTARLGNPPMTMTQSVWAYNSQTNSWTQKSNFPGLSMYDGGGFAIGGYGYIVNGFDSTASGSGSNALWQYNPATDSWVQKSPFPASARYDDAWFVLNNKAYVACGFKPYSNDLWEYDPSTDTWTQKASFPGDARETPVHFVLNGYAYVGMGAAYNPYTSGWVFESDMYKYDPSADSWTQLNYFPYQALAGTYSVVINNQVYLINGAYESSFSTFQSQIASDIWQYNAGSDSWSLWGVFPDSATGDGRFGVTSTGAYFGLGTFDATTYPLTGDFWRFGPGTVPYSCTATIKAMYVNSGERNFQAGGNFSAAAQLNWNFGDSTTGSGTSVFHNFSAPGTYVVSLIVNDTAISCTDTVMDTIVIGGLDTCSVTINSTNIGPDYTLAATPTGAGPFTYVWTIPGDPYFYDITPDPWILLPADTPVVFCLTITDTTGCQASVCDTVTYVPTSYPCQTYIYVAPDPNYPGVYDCYVFHTGATPIGYLWNFGDGDTSTQQYPTHSYAAPGFYNICLTITDSANCVSTFCDSAFYALKVGGGPMTQLNSYSGQGHGATTAIQNTGNIMGITVFPNPTNDELTISVNGNKIDKAIIYSTEGQIVEEFESPASNKVSVQQLAAGMYFIDVKVGENSGRVRFVKTN